MRRLATFWFFSAALAAHAQDIPLFTQKLTNAFLYNPSVAGNTLGSITLARRQHWKGIQGSPNSTLLSAHLPVNGYRFGTGLTVYQDNVGVSQTLSANGAFAYHLILPSRQSFSLGVSAEYYNYRVVPSRVDVQATGWSDPVLLSRYTGVNGVDFSAGVSYYSRYLRAGASINRISGWLGSEHRNLFQPFFTGFVQGILPLADKRHGVEPMLTYRSLNPESALLEGGLYYTFDKKITLGASYRTGKVVSVATSFQVYKNLTIGYSNELFASQRNVGLGPSHEIAVRFDFNDRTDLQARKSPRYLNTAQLQARRKPLVNYFVPKVAVRKYKHYVRKTRRISNQALFEWRAKKTPRKKRMTIKKRK
ncbi:PorP/SprF family type IX secretion system membrane protein [Chryseolinea soli]|uniref:Type IX secretion system membrane protein PorP/SprF n=1 Tax=Chryseolinea soli TaxID=2321403 RepID=A0A385SL89_9BACT|nr:PorP/SprF family type IX secretion system membrane protein [Chryseolinea soli]AYB31246.1 type IX secretion system membrane protein PorP/SprF [Chryseolinea soli]